MDKTNIYQRLPFSYSWVVLGFSFLALFATFGIRVSFGGYITSWEQEFTISRTAVTLISLISFIVLAISQPLIGKLNDRFGARTVLTVSMFLIGVALLLCSVANSLWQLALLYGVIASFALTGGSNITTTAVITRWFNAKRGLAMGITLSGMAVGQLVVVPVSLYLIANTNWRFTTGLIGLIVLVVFMPLMAFFVRSKPLDVGMQPYGETAPVIKEGTKIQANSTVDTGSQSVWTILKQPVFWQLSIPNFFCGFTDVGLVQTHYIPFAQGKGFSLGIIALTFSIIAIANIFGAIGSGYLADRLDRSRLMAIIYSVRGSAILLLLIADQPWLLIIFALLFGITDMAAIAPISSFCATLFGKYSIGVTLGLVSVSHQLGGAIGSLIPGIIYDSMHSYVPIFIISAIFLGISALIITRVPDNQGKKEVAV